MTHFIDSMAYIAPPHTGMALIIMSPLKQSLYIWLQAAGDFELETTGSLKGARKL